MKSRYQKIRRNRQTPSRALTEAMEPRLLLSSTTLTQTLTNDPTGSPVEGSLTVTVDPFGGFGENFPQSGALYDPFPFGNDNAYNSVRESALYFQPAGGFLTGEYALPDSTNFTTDQTASSAATNVQFTSNPGNAGQVDTAVSTFSIAGFNIVLTQTVSPVPGSDSNTYLTQTYQITDVSNSAYVDVPFNVVHMLYVNRTDASISNWGALSGDGRIGIAFTDLSANAVFQRIDASGVDGTGNSVADWDNPVGFNAAGLESTSSEDANYYQTIDANQGIPIADNGVVEGDTNNDRLDDTQLPDGQELQAVVAVQDSLEFTSLNQTITYTTHTGWGDTGAEAPSIYHLPGTFNVSSVTASAPEGTNAIFSVTRTDGSLGHASVDLNTTHWLGTATPGNSDNPDADFQAYDGPNDTGGTGLPAQVLTLADGETATGGSSFSADPTVAVFNDTKIEPSEFFFAQITDPTDNAKLVKGDDPTSPPTDTQVSIPENDQPSPFHFTSTDPASGDTITTSFDESPNSGQIQYITIPVVRNTDDGGNPNTGPYGNFSVQYTVTGSGADPATPGQDINGVATPTDADFYDVTPGSDGVAGSASNYSNGEITGTLNFTAASTTAEAQTPTLGVSYQYITLAILPDDLYEGPETFTVTLQSGNSLLVGTPSNFTGTIQDQQSSGPVHLQYGTQSVDESAGTQSIGVLRAGSTNGQVTIGYTIAGSGANPAIPGVDFTDATPGSLLSNGTDTGTLTFDVDSTTPEQALLLDLIPTDQASADKTLTITLTNPNNLPNILGTPSSETLTITNKNTPGVVYFLGGPTATVAEGADPVTGNPYKILTLQVTRDPADGDTGAVSVNYSTSDGTAKAGTDYQGTTGTLTWADGETGTKNVNIEVYDDTTDPYPRSNKTFSIALSDPTGGVALASPSSVVVTITDNQQPGINLSDTTYSVDEKDPSTGQPGVADIVVQRNLGAGQSAAAWSFTYSISPGSALAGVDYAKPSGSTTVTVTDPNQSTYVLQIPILADDNNVNDTSFTVRLTGGSIGSDAAALGATTTATVNITNADTDVALGASSYSATPGAGMIPITINRTGRSDEAINVSYTTADGTAKAGTDYTATTGTAEIPAGSNSVTVNVPILTPANSTSPTRSFTFKITNAVLADSSQSNSYTVNSSSTPATIGIAGLVTATGLSLEAGRGGKIDMVVVNFSDPLNSSGVNNTYNYVLTTAGKKGAFNSQILLTNAAYDASTDSVTLFTKKPLSANKLYQLSIRTDGGLVSMSNEPFITGSPGGLGGTQVATFATGSKIKYTDPDGDLVTLQTKRRGSLQFINGIDGAYPDVTVFGTTKTELTGTLKADGDGHTIIASLNNPDGVQDLLAFNPLFTVE